MNDWEKAVFMLEEGFTPTQLKSLNPSDAEAWIRLKPLILKRDDYVEKNTTERPDTKLSKTIVKDTQPIVGGCQGVNNQGNPCKVKNTTAKMHADKCQREEKDFCWMHCDCSHCSQLMGGPTNTQGKYFVEVTA